jgi:NADH:ubiquinone oxidoreductase subunit E
MIGMGKKVGAVLVVGGGIGGVQASLDLAESGYKVYLLEKAPAIGGKMAQLDKTFPTNDCSMCIMAPKLVECGRHPNIEIVTRAEVRKLEGEAGDFTATVCKEPRFVDEEKCTGCGTCEENCPVQYKIYEPEKIKVRLEPEKASVMERIMARYEGMRGGIVQILHDINAVYRYLPEDCLRYVSMETGIPLSVIFHISTFYNAFGLTPKGEYSIQVCFGTACYAKGAERILDAFKRELGIKVAETTPDKLFDLQTISCFGCCGQAPVVVVNEELFGHFRIARVGKMLDTYRKEAAVHA